MRNFIHKWLRTGEAARCLEVSPDRVRQLERHGDLEAVKISGGLRLFRVRDVEKLKAERAARKARVK